MFSDCQLVLAHKLRVLHVAGVSDTLTPGMVAHTIHKKTRALHSLKFKQRKAREFNQQQFATFFAPVLILLPLQFCGRSVSIS